MLTGKELYRYLEAEVIKHRMQKAGELGPDPRAAKKDAEDAA